ncbi:hypothetical protein O181_096627 [Austropuccinia psidii MF-1]|uniref:Coenzyme Q-binding protein COQ10 START domain-containing protein n=1 Tax=Austropuccinia psidii MF-1 TaxID=1389203 RepID=A0A9Q3PDP0_9BASI|nr:hypothetical protein [Austropuccinia psidii MF-1]
MRRIPNLGPWSLSRTYLRKFSVSLLSPGTHRLVKELPYQQAQIYSVIVDVGAYPEFIPYCLSTQILRRATKQINNIDGLSAQAKDERDCEEMDVITRVGYKGFQTDYWSHVICVPLNSVQVIARPSSTFSHLKTTWFLSPSKSDSNSNPSSDYTQVTLDLTFKFKNPLHEYLLTDDLIWKKFSTTTIQAFESRLLKIFGSQHS